MTATELGGAERRLRVFVAFTLGEFPVCVGTSGRLVVVYERNAQG